MNSIRFKKWHLKSTIIKPLYITPSFIEIGDRVHIWHNARIEGVRVSDKNPKIEIQDGVSIQQNLHLTCAEYVCIGKNTAIVSNVTITDIEHPYAADDIPVVQLPIKIKPTRIGDYCCIYSNSVILSGVTIGNHVIIGANSVVTKDIPDYSVAVGNPARVIKKYNFASQQWEKC